MDSLPTGSDKLLEIRSGNIYFVIKSKNPYPYTADTNIFRQPSELEVTGTDVTSVRIFGDEKIPANSISDGVSSYNICTSPLFFEQTDYEIVIRNTDGEPVSFRHENYAVRNKISSVGRDDLITGIVNFGTDAGFSDFEIFSGGIKALVVRIEVFPSKISYKEDYQEMLRDISNEIYGAVLDFMRNTYREFSIDYKQGTVPVMFFEIIRHIFGKLKNAVNVITSSPHHKLYAEHIAVPSGKVKKTDNQTVKWLRKHSEKIIPVNDGYSAVKALAVRKRISYNTTENQFAKFILKSAVRKLKGFKERYIRSTRIPEESVLNSLDSMTGTLSKLINTTFFREVGDYKAAQGMSLVFEMAPGYRELYKYYLMMNRGLSVNGDVFRMSLKDTSQLYEYWCFIKLVALMKRNCRLASPDVIKVDNTGVTVSLVKGRRFDVKFINPRTGEKITLSYNPGEQNSQTVSPKPGNVLTLEKRGSNVQYMYVFDAKYRIESNPSDPFYPDDKPGPKTDDINRMHRYRDSIVYENSKNSGFMFEKRMFGAYVLFPYNNGYDYVNGIHIHNGKEEKGHKFYNSIETVNIGGLPFLPGTTEPVDSFLAELVADSSESAFERASLPCGIKEKLAKVDWSVRDVMVGTVRTAEQLKFNIEKKWYYVPARFITDDILPVKYIALHEEGLGSPAGIKVYGEVLEARRAKRSTIPTPTKSNPNEIYYCFRVREWVRLPQTIAIRDSWRGRPQFTNKFLLDNCTKSYQLFAITSKEEYRLMAEIDKAFDNLSASEKNDNTAVYRINDTHTVAVSDGYFTVMNDNGDIIDQIAVKDFAKAPRAGFNKIKKMIG